MIWHLAHLERRVLKLSYEAVALIVVIGVCRVITFADVAKPYWFTYVEAWAGLLLTYARKLPPPNLPPSSRAAHPPFPSPVCFRTNRRKSRRKGKKRERKSNSAVPLSSVIHGGQGNDVTVPNGPRRPRRLGTTVGCHGHAVRHQGWERKFSGIRIGRPSSTAMRELLGLLQYLLWTRTVGLELLSLWNPQRPHIWGHYSLLSTSVVCGDDVVIHRSRIAW